MFDRIVSLLTDNYRKNKKSNTGKFFLVITDELNSIKSTLNKIEEYRDVDKAAGYTLDKIGGNIKQFRGISSDEIYRTLIKYKLRGISSTGDINQIISILSDILEVPPSEIGIDELYNNDIEKEPAALSIVGIPFDALLSIGMSSEQFIQVLKLSVPAGVRIAELKLEGTFEFSSLENIYDNDKGFGDLDNEEIGGTLGATYKSGESDELPL